MHTLGDAHLYSNHLDQARLQLTREPRPLPTLWLDPAVTDDRRLRPRAHRGRGLRPAPGHQGPDRGMTADRVASGSCWSPRSPQRRHRQRPRHPVADPGEQAEFKELTMGHTLRHGPRDVRVDRPAAARAAPPSCSPATRLVAPTACSSRTTSMAALALAATQPTGDVMVAGGAQVYAAALPVADAAGAHRGAPRARGRHPLPRVRPEREWVETRPRAAATAFELGSGARGPRPRRLRRADGDSLTP